MRLIVNKPAASRQYYSDCDTSRHTTKPGPKPRTAKPTTDLRVVTKALAPLFKELKGRRGYGMPSHPRVAKIVDDIRALLDGWNDPALTETLGPLFDTAKAEMTKPMALYSPTRVLDAVTYAQRHLDGWASDPGARIPTPASPKVTAPPPVKSAPSPTSEIVSADEKARIEEENKRYFDFMKKHRLDPDDGGAVDWFKWWEELRFEGLDMVEDGHMQKLIITDRDKAVAWFEIALDDFDEAHPKATREANKAAKAAADKTDPDDTVH